MISKSNVKFTDSDLRTWLVENNVFGAIKRLSLFSLKQLIRQLLDSVFVISEIIKVSVSVISLSGITLTSTLIIPDIKKTSSNICLYVDSFGQLLFVSLNVRIGVKRGGFFFRCITAEMSLI